MGLPGVFAPVCPKEKFNSQSYLEMSEDMVKIISPLGIGGFEFTLGSNSPHVELRTAWSPQGLRAGAPNENFKS